MAEALRQSDRDMADQVAIERARAADAREQVLRSEVAPARTEARAQVQAERPADLAAASLRFQEVEQQLAERKASSEALAAALTESRAQTHEQRCLVLESRRLADERGAQAAEAEADAAEQSRAIMAEAERRHA